MIYRRYASLFFIIGVEPEEEVRRAGWCAGRRVARGVEKEEEEADARTLPRRRAQNELGMLEFIHAFVETLDKYFENVVRLRVGEGCEREGRGGRKGDLHSMPSAACLDPQCELDIMFNLEKAHFILGA